MSNPPNPFVSVVIPVFNDAERLKTCLEALENQTYPKNCYEVIVVDNGSDEDIEDVVSYTSQAYITHESRLGSYAARNKGISLAKGEVIGFTDADCTPAPDWIEKGVMNLLRVPNCGLLAGRIELFFKNSEQPTAVELYESVAMGFPQKKYVEEYKFGATANVFTFSRIIDSVGLFDDTLKSSGDREWGQRVFAAGYEQIYANDVCVRHPARHSLEQLHKKIIRRVGGGQDVKNKKGYPFWQFLRDLAIDLSPPFRVYFRIWSNENIKGSKQKIQFTLIFLYVKYLTAWEKVRVQLGGTSTRS